MKHSNDGTTVSKMIVDYSQEREYVKRNDSLENITVASSAF